MALDPTTGSSAQKKKRKSAPVMGEQASGGSKVPKRKPQPQRRPPPPPSYGAPQRSVESPGSSSQVRNPSSLKSYPFIRANAGVNWQGVSPTLLQKLNFIGARTNNVITLTSGFRTHAEQRRLYAAYLRGEIGLAAPPGQSNHESGDAVDALVDGQAIGNAIPEQVLNAAGLRSLTHLDDAYHVELSDGGGSGGRATQATPAPSTAQPGRALPVTSSVSQEHAGTSDIARTTNDVGLPIAPAPTDEFAGVTDMAELLPFELEDEVPQAARMNAQQRAQTWQLIAQQPGASPEAQSLARIAQISIGQ